MFCKVRTDYAFGVMLSVPLSVARTAVKACTDRCFLLRQLHAALLRKFRTFQAFYTHTCMHIPLMHSGDTLSGLSGITARESHSSKPDGLTDI